MHAANDLSKRDIFGGGGGEEAILMLMELKEDLKRNHLRKDKKTASSKHHCHQMTLLQLPAVPTSLYTSFNFGRVKTGWPSFGQMEGREQNLMIGETHKMSEQE